MTKIKKVTNIKNQDMKFSLLVLLLVFLCSFLCVIATFTQLNVFILSEGKLKVVPYIPQIPTVLFIAGLLGKKYGLLSVILYILTGLFLVPVFAHGGGLDYILNMNFGYILAFIPAVFFVSKIIEKSISFFAILFSDIFGIAIIHVIGMIYLSIVLIISKESMSTILTWIINQSLNYLAIDLVFGFVAISVGCFVRLLLKKFA